MTLDKSVGLSSADVLKAMDKFGILDDETTLPFTVTGRKLFLCTEDTGCLIN